MFTGEGLLRIADFGLAKSASSDLTRDGSTVGTAGYMAPEQATNNETSPRSDLFSLGVMLHEMIAGQRHVFRQQRVRHDALRGERLTPAAHTVPAGRTAGSGAAL